MKANKASKASNLPVDVIEYMFIEWLVRQGIFSLYRANCVKFYPNHRSFRDNLRDKLRRVLRSSGYRVDSLISTSFPFAMTPEGVDFWVDYSNLWRRFCDNFRSIL